MKGSPLLLALQRLLLLTKKMVQQIILVWDGEVYAYGLRLCKCYSKIYGISELC